MDVSFAYDDARGVYDWVDGDDDVSTTREACSEIIRRDFEVVRGVLFALVLSVPLWAAVIGFVVALAS
jgi:hypothetical protein